MQPEENNLSLEELDALLNAQDENDAGSDEPTQKTPATIKGEDSKSSEEAQEFTDDLTGLLQQTSSDSSAPRMGLDLESLNALATSIEQTKKEVIPSIDVSNESLTESDDTPTHERNFLMGVNMNVSVRFGHTEINIQQVSKLKENSTLGLDNKENELVDLFINNKHFGRGKLVAVDGCYGVKITEIITNNLAT